MGLGSHLSLGSEGLVQIPAYNHNIHDNNNNCSSLYSILIVFWFTVFLFTLIMIGTCSCFSDLLLT